ncbi:amidophosphoribosyltransferase [Flavobacteriaceae bacterium UJ101]|nr:amidophosphoribosyltransferase [Flavobacteriaceae bacterium UJ101]
MLFDLFQLFFPKYCTHCQNTLLKEETIICNKCYQKLPFRFQSYHNELKENLNCLFKVEKAYSLLYFKDQSITSNLIYTLKYKKKPKIGYELGILLGERILDPIDMIIPIPLHPKKQKKRGYNQSEEIAKGIAKKRNISIDLENLIRTKNNPSQAYLKNQTERLQNTLNIFEVLNPKLFENKHILLVDDIITTGSTVYNSAYPLLQIKNVRISVACISFAG